jgi:hypothetical protein
VGRGLNRSGALTRAALFGRHGTKLQSRNRPGQNNDLADWAEEADPAFNSRLLSQDPNE